MMKIYGERRSKLTPKSARNEIDWDILSEIRKFEPFGEGNREPVFLTKICIFRGLSGSETGKNTSSLFSDPIVLKKNLSREYFSKEEIVSPSFKSGTKFPSSAIFGQMNGTETTKLS